jgi:uncharacterized membrane protein
VATTIRIEGGEKVLAALRSYGDAAAPALGRALYGEANVIFNDSQEIVPVDTGTLKNTGYVHQPQSPAPGIVEVLVSYGGPAAAYALAVHERLGVRHKPPTQAKYLETPLLARSAGMAARIAQRMGDGMGLK